MDCDKQHVRECPDFAEKNTCPNPRCKLPHVIRSNQRRTEPVPVTNVSEEPAREGIKPDKPGTDEYRAHTNDSQGVLGDEYISLTFHESDASEIENDSEDSAESDEESEHEEDASMEVHM